MKKREVKNEPPQRNIILRRSVLSLLLLLGLSAVEPAAAQQSLKQITGTVTDAKQQPIPGINVYVKNQLQRGAATAIDGTYSLKIEPATQSIIFSGIGYETQTIKYTGQSVIDVKMVENVTTLDEVNVVSIGYGQQKREKVSGSIVSITSKDLLDAPATSFATLLQGKLPGVTINNWSGEPGVRNEVYIRGVGVVGNDRTSSPLYVIDGIPQEQSEDRTLQQRGSSTDPLSLMNPNDIESVDILKDAAATAIYGSRGANGVILVKTKRGIKDRPIISFKADLTVNAVPALQQTVGGNKERDLKLKIWNLQKGNQDLPINLSDSLNPFWNNSTNWQDIFYKPSVTQDYSLSISGGTKGITYRVSLGYTKDKGIMPGSDFERYSLSTSTKYEPFKDFFLDLTVRMGRTDKGRPNGSNNALTTSVGSGISYPSSLIPSSNSEAMKKQQDAFKLMESTDLNDNIAPSLGISFAFLKDFHWQSTFSMNYTKAERNIFKPSALNGTTTGGKLNGPSINMSESGNQSYSMDHILSYLKTFNEKHTADIVIGFNQRLNESNNLYANATKGISDAIHDLNGYTAANTTSSSRYVAYGSQSYFIRAQYDYMSRYIASVSWRADGSSRFGENYRYAFFPSVALAYNLHREKFMEPVTWLDQFKVRWSWGITGTESGISEYLTQGLYDTSNKGGFFGSGSVATYNGQGIVMPNYTSGLANPDLTWEEAEQYNFGIDWSMFKYRLNINFDAFWKQNRDILFDFALPDISGYEKVYRNATELVNYGYEFSVTGQIFDPVTSKFTWKTSINGAFTKNYVTKLPNGNIDVLKNGNQEILRVGRPANGFFVYQTDGIYANDSDVPVNPYTGAKLSMNQKTFQAGDYVILDLDGSGTIYEVNAATGGLMTSDRAFTGNPYPVVVGGWNNTFRYKQWSLDANFAYSIGRQIMNLTQPTRMMYALQGAESNIYDYTQDNHWQQAGDQADFPVMNPDRYKDFTGMYNASYSRLDRYIEDASFLRLNNVRLGYDVDREALKKFYIRRLFIYANGMNLWTLTNYSGADPENVTLFGIDNGTQYARPQRYNLGLMIEF